MKPNLVLAVLAAGVLSAFSVNGASAAPVNLVCVGQWDNGPFDITLDVDAKTVSSQATNPYTNATAQITDSTISWDARGSSEDVAIQRPMMLNRVTGVLRSQLCDSRARTASARCTGVYTSQCHKSEPIL